MAGGFVNGWGTTSWATDWFDGWMTERFGESFGALTLPLDLLKQGGGIFIDYKLIAGVGLVAAIVTPLFLAWRWWRRRLTEQADLREAARYAREQKSTAEYKVAKMEKDLARLRAEDSIPSLAKKIDTLVEEVGSLKSGGHPHQGGLGEAPSPLPEAPSTRPSTRAPYPLADPLVSKEMDPLPPSLSPSPQPSLRVEGASSGVDGVKRDPHPSSRGSLAPLPAPLDEPSLGDVTRWAAENLQPCRGAHLQSQPEIDRYNQWCVEHRKRPVPSTTFALKMKELGYQKKTIKGLRHWMNVARKEPEQKVVRFPRSTNENGTTRAPGS
jgi:hypothetical protein